MYVLHQQNIFLTHCLFVSCTHGSIVSIHIEITSKYIKSRTLSTIIMVIIAINIKLIPPTHDENHSWREREREKRERTYRKNLNRTTENIKLESLSKKGFLKRRWCSGITSYLIMRIINLL